MKGDPVEVVGRGTVSLHDGSDHGAPNVVILLNLHGERYDLAARAKKE